MDEMQGFWDRQLYLKLARRNKGKIQRNSVVSLLMTSGAMYSFYYDGFIRKIPFVYQFIFLYMIYRTYSNIYTKVYMYSSSEENNK